MTDTQTLKVGPEDAVEVVAPDPVQATVTNLGPNSAYYDDVASVSSVSNDGTLAMGASLTFSASKHFISAGRSRLSIEVPDRLSWVEGRVDSLSADLAAVEGGAISFQDGDDDAPGVRFASDTNTGIARLGTDRFAFVTGGVVRAYFQNDGTFIVPDTAAGDPLNLTSGTAPGSIVTGYNRAFRTINAAQTGTIRLLNANSLDEISLGNGGTEGGPPTAIILRSGPVTELFGKVIVYDDFATPAARITFDPTGSEARIQLDGLTASQTFLATKQAGDTVPRMALLEGGREEYSSGSAGADVIVIPRNSAGVWRLALGDMLLNGGLEVDGAFDHDGSTVGFYGATPTAKQTGVAVSAAGIHAALVTLGLIAA